MTQTTITPELLRNALGFVPANLPRDEWARVGMAITLPLLIAVASLASGEFRLKEVLINAAVLTLGCWLVFIKGLNLTIPLWPTFLA